VDDGREAVVSEVQAPGEVLAAEIVVWSPGAHHDRRVRDVLSQCDWSDDLHPLNAAAVHSRVVVEKSKEVPCGTRGVDGMDRFGGFPSESPGTDEQQPGEIGLHESNGTSGATARPTDRVGYKAQVEFLP
jgi:hypothetical protein